MGYVREYCQDCQKEHLKRTVCDDVSASKLMPCYVQGRGKDYEYI